MFKVLLCLSSRHDWRLVVLAGLVCGSATVAAFYLYSKTPRFGAWKRFMWLSMTGVAAGSGIWTTHFLAMLAFRTGLRTGYAPGPTLGSLLIAITSVTLGFAVADAPRLRTWPRTMLGGVLVGVGINLMHYVGMWGYRTTGIISWDQTYLAASVLIGTVLACAALQAGGKAANLRRQALAGMLLTIGVVGMHFTGMTAVTILPDPTIVVPTNLMSTAMMAVIAVAVTAMILLTTITGVGLDTALRDASLRRLRDALDAIPEGLAFFDSADRLAAWNARYSELCRADGAELFVGMSFHDLIRTKLAHGAYPEAAGREEEWLAERNAAHCGQLESLTQKRSSGRWLLITDRRTPDGGTISVSVDITELKQARDRAEQSAARAEFAEGLARVGHWRFEASSGAVSWSPQMYKMYGLTPGSPLVLEQLLAMTHPDDFQDATQRLERQLAGGGPESSLTRIVREDGQERLLSGTSCPERDQDGRIVGVVGTLIDVTEQKLLEEELRQARRDAEHAAVVKSEFLANMSHELRTPLTSIVGFTGLAAAQTDLPPLAREYIDRVAGAGRALLCTVNDILDFSKLEAGQVVFHVQPTSLSEIGSATLDLFTPQAAAKDVELSFEMPGDAHVLVDPDRVRQVLLNLVGNAVKFTRAGRVTLQMRYDDIEEQLEVGVVDTGQGVPAEKIDALFQRFSQVDGALNRAHGGTGLGLAICKGIVEAMGGQIGVESQIGKGSRFWFKMPAARAPAPQEQQATGGRFVSILPGMRVLVADDHAANRELARLFLEGVGAQVSEAIDGEEAVRFAKELPFDVILMDVQMPEMTGTEALRRIRSERGPNDRTPIIAFTAAADTQNIHHLQSMGFDDVIAKPLEPGVLLEAVAKAANFLDQSLAHVG